MTTIYDGGPANPIGNESGISIRDYFATAIMSGIYAANTQGGSSAQEAYRAADLMLAARTADLYAEAPAVIEPVTPIAPVVDAPVTDVPAEPTV